MLPARRRRAASSDPSRTMAADLGLELVPKAVSATGEPGAEREPDSPDLRTGWGFAFPLHGRTGEC